MLIRAARLRQLRSRVVFCLGAIKCAAWVHVFDRRGQGPVSGCRAFSLAMRSRITALARWSSEIGAGEIVPPVARVTGDKEHRTSLPPILALAGDRVKRAARRLVQ